MSSFLSTAVQGAQAIASGQSRVSRLPDQPDQTNQPDDSQFATSQTTPELDGAAAPEQCSSEECEVVTTVDELRQLIQAVVDQKLTIDQIIDHVNSAGDGQEINIADLLGSIDATQSDSDNAPSGFEIDTSAVDNVPPSQVTGQDDEWKKGADSFFGSTFR